MCKVWYELLISDEFIEYFSDENNRFYSVEDNKVVLEPMFQKYKDIIHGITCFIDSKTQIYSRYLRLIAVPS